MIRRPVVLLEDFMKALLSAAFASAMLAGQPTPALAQEEATAAERADTALAVSLWQIAVASNTRIGFESAEVLNTVGLFRNAPTSLDSTLEGSLDAAVAAHPGYEWRRAGDVIVVRPEQAWSDAANQLNRQVRHFRAEGTNEARVLTGVSSLIHTGTYEERLGNGTPVRIAVESGTVVDVMNRLAESADVIFWQAGYKPRPYDQRLTGWDLDLTLVNHQSLRAASFTRTPENSASRPSGN